LIWKERNRVEQRDATNAASCTAYSVSGLEAPVEILIDSWGVPHIYASSIYDAFLAQGFNAARDRLWQIDLWRRRGLGLLSEVFGPAYLEQDQAARLFLYRGDMRQEWLTYGSDAVRLVTAFVEGVNEYVRIVEEKLELLPVEFGMMDYRPALWSAEDVVRIRSHGLYRNITDEVARALTVRDFGPEVEALRSRLEPPWELTVPEGLDLSLIPDDVLRIYELATSPVEFSENAAENNAERRHGKLREEGSNNWVISPARTATGRPILANDPHREQSVPSQRYVAHLVAPGLNVIGAGEPTLPGISTGHNENVAFGFTIFSVDQEDLYVYETNPEDPSEYRYEGRWEPMKAEKQQIPIKGEEPAEVELKYTRHGPVIYEDPEKRVAFAVRVAWLEPGMAPYLGSVEYMRAKDWDQFLAAMNRWGTPGENLIYTDTNGNIGWKAAGITPIRPNWDGLFPVPGDGRYEWDGFLGINELPMEFNPSRGWIATANEMNLPEGYPYEEKKVGFEWLTPFRRQRIDEVLGKNLNHTLRDSVKLQTDYLSVPARRIVAALNGLHSEDPKVERALQMLRQWDFILSKESAPAALFEVWYRFHLRGALVASIVSPEAKAVVTEESFESDAEVGDPRAILELIESPDERLGPEPNKTRSEAMLSSLKGAIEHLERLLGSDPRRWEWGKLHHAFFAHPLSPLVDEETRRQLNVGPLPRGGSGDTVGNTGYRVEDFRQTGGSSWRMVVDVGNWDDSLFINTPGQSGDPRSPHYADLFEEWARDGTFPLLYNREKIETTVEQKIVLEPKES
jgi:penicillin amidase